MKRVLRNDTFKTGLYDTSFIEKNQAELLGDKPLTEQALKQRIASVALANVWFENEGHRLRRSADVDPWGTLDNFRVNHTAKRDITLKEGEDKFHKLKIEYLSENKFNVLIQTDKLGLENEKILSNAEVVHNPERPGELLIRTDNEQFRLPYLLEEQTHEVFCLDNEGAPLKIVKKKDELESQEGSLDMGKQEFVKSPMPGTVVKVYVKPGQEVKANDPLISVESMKMEFLIRATHDVKVKEIRVNEAQFVQMGERLIIFEAEKQ